MLTKYERVCDRKSIQELFGEKSSSFYLYPFRVKIRETEDSVSRILVSVPKRRFKRANVRNLLKRRIREAYRLNKSLLFASEKSMDIAFLYVGKDIMDYNSLEKKLISVLKRLMMDVDGGADGEQ